MLRLSRYRGTPVSALLLASDVVALVAVVACVPLAAIMQVPVVLSAAALFLLIVGQLIAVGEVQTDKRALRLSSLSKSERRALHTAFFGFVAGLLLTVGFEVIATKHSLRGPVCVVTWACGALGWVGREVPVFAAGAFFSAHIAVLLNKCRRSVT